MKVYFIRHGQTAHNTTGYITGHLDISVTDEGILEVEEALEKVPADFSVMYSSDLIRCRQTADILNKKLKLPIIYDVRLRERNFGSLQGKKWEEFDPDFRDKDFNQTYDYRAYGGESVDEFKSRLLAFIDDMRNKEKGG